MFTGHSEGFPLSFRAECAFPLVVLGGHAFPLSFRAERSSLRPLSFRAERSSLRPLSFRAERSEVEESYGDA